MKSKDQKFFDDFWQEWIKVNPPPKTWQGTKKEYAELEMPCRGNFGKFLFWLNNKIFTLKAKSNNGKEKNN